MFKSDVLQTALGMVMGVNITARQGFGYMSV